MELRPFSEDFPRMIGTSERLIMRCGHEQVMFAGAQVPEEEQDPDAWEPDFRAGFENGLRWELERTQRVRDCATCEACLGMTKAEVRAEIRQAKVIQKAAQAAQVQARDARREAKALPDSERAAIREAHEKARTACEVVYWRLWALEQRLEFLKELAAAGCPEGD
jgi:hypothetical protein